MNLHLSEGSPKSNIVSRVRCWHAQMRGYVREAEAQPISQTSAQQLPCHHRKDTTREKKKIRERSKSSQSINRATKSSLVGGPRPMHLSLASRTTTRGVGLSIDELARINRQQTSILSGSVAHAMELEKITPSTASAPLFVDLRTRRFFVQNPPWRRPRGRENRAHSTPRKRK